VKTWHGLAKCKYRGGGAARIIVRAARHLARGGICNGENGGMPLARGAAWRWRGAAARKSNEHVAAKGKQLATSRQAAKTR